MQINSVQPNYTRQNLNKNQVGFASMLKLPNVAREAFSDYTAPANVSITTIDQDHFILATREDRDWISRIENKCNEKALAGRYGSYEDIYNALPDNIMDKAESATEHMEHIIPDLKAYDIRHRIAKNIPVTKKLADALKILGQDLSKDKYGKAEINENNKNITDTLKADIAKYQKRSIHSPGLTRTVNELKEFLA